MQEYVEVTEHALMVTEKCRVAQLRDDPQSLLVCSAFCNCPCWYIFPLMFFSYYSSLVKHWSVYLILSFFVVIIGPSGASWTRRAAGDQGKDPDFNPHRFMSVKAWITIMHLLSCGIQKLLLYLPQGEQGPAGLPGLDGEQVGCLWYQSAFSWPCLVARVSHLQCDCSSSPFAGMQGLKGSKGDSGISGATGEKGAIGLPGMPVRQA